MVWKDIAENQTLREHRSVYLWRVIFGGQNIRGSAILVSLCCGLYIAACIAGKGKYGCFIRG